MTASGKRSRLPPEQRRAQLLALGVDLLADRTLDELSIEDLAEAAGVSRGLLFHYFSGKADFHLQVVRAAADDLIERTAPDPAWPADEVLVRSVAAFVGYVETNRRAYVALVRGASSGDDAVRAVFESTRERLAGRTVEVMEALGLVVDPTARLAVRGWIAFVEDVTVSWCTAPDAPDKPSRGQLLDLLTRALPGVVFGSAVDVIGVAAAAARSDERVTAPGR